MIRLAIVDDQALIRAGLARILSPADGFELVAEAGDGAEGVSVVADHDLDVVLMDIRMRGMDGIEATRAIRRADGPPVLILTTFDDDETLAEAIDAGAAGFGGGASFTLGGTRRRRGGGVGFAFGGVGAGGGAAFLVTIGVGRAFACG